MPRAKVLPENRQRVAQACTNCKASKRKCNAELPCSHCTRKGVASECQFVSSDESRSSKSAEAALAGTAGLASSPDHCQPDARRLSSVTDRGQPSKDVRVAMTGTSRASVLSGYQHWVDRPANHSIDAAPRDTPNTIHPFIQSPDVSSSSTSRGQAVNTAKPRMLSTSAGERLFVGGSASLSFLQLVRETVSRCIGVSEFSEYPTRDRMLEADLNLESGTDDGFASLTSQKQEEYIRRYFLATNGVLDLVDKDEVKGLLEKYRDGETLRTATAMLIIAIGAQTVPLSHMDARMEKAVFSRGQKIAFGSMLENPSVDMVRVFTLLAFYMLGACRRNGAFMYLGVAARAAHALGLHHTESYKVLNKESKQPRVRCWKSLVALDIIVSSILGRASATTITKQSDEIIGSTPIDTPSSRPELEAAYQLAISVNSVLNEFYTLKIMTVEAAESHLRKLRTWSDSLPSQLRLSGLPQGGRHVAQESVLGSLQISCFYYFAVMLVTRPFLISHLTTGLTLMQDGSDVTLNTEDGPEVTELAAACLSAATFMAQTCADVLNLEFMLENMCLMKAWIFAAGLVLGFHIFASRDLDAEVEEAFASTQKVLKTFSTRSPQAAHYLDILSRLTLAIDKQKDLLKSRKRKRAASFVTRIVDLQPQDASVSVPNNSITADPSASYTGPFFNDPVMTFQLDPQLLQQDMDMENMFYGWDGTAFALDDHFSAETQNSDGTGWSFTC